MNKYLEKLAGVPITEHNLGQVARTLVNKTRSFQSSPGIKSLAKMTSTADRLNRKVPANLKGKLNKLTDINQRLRYE